MNTGVCAIYIILFISIRGLENLQLASQSNYQSDYYTEYYVYFRNSLFKII
jgi:hypothetical protein